MSPLAVVPTGATRVSMPRAGMRMRYGVIGPFAGWSVEASVPISGFTVEIGLPKSSRSEGRAVRRVAFEGEERTGAGARRVAKVVNAIIPATTASRWERRRRKSRPRNPTRVAPRKRPPPDPPPEGEGETAAMPPLGGPGSPVPVTVVLETSFPGTGSGSFSAVLRAVFRTGPVVVTVATTVRVAEAPLASDPMVQTPVPVANVPVDGVPETSVSPLGSGSVTCTPVASDAPALWAVIVNVTFEPVTTVALLAIFA